MNEDKRVRWSWSYLQSIPDTENLYLLTDRDVQALLTPLAVAMWRTRWTDTPSNFDEINTLFASIQDRLLSPMDFCQLVADCLLDLDSPARDALKELLLDGDNPVLPPNLAPVKPETVIPAPSSYPDNILPDCNPDNIFGLCMQVIDLTFSMVVDALEIIELLSNAVEASIIIADDVPVLSQSLDVINFIQETGYETYIANATELKKQELACDLFCFAYDACALSIDDIYDFFASKYLLPIPSSIESLLADIALIASGEDFFNALNALMWACILDGFKWLGIQSSSQAIRLISSFFNDPNSDWTTLCNSCLPVPIVPVTVTFDAGGYENYTILQGTIQALGNTGNCLRDSRTCSFCSNSASIDVLFDEPQNVNQISVQVYTRFALISWSLVAYDASNNVLYSVGGNPATTPNGWTTLNYTGLALSGVSRVRVQNANGSGGSSTFLDNRIDNIYIA